jgi:DNA-binding response OmpR family regulator
MGAGEKGEASTGALEITVLVVDDEEALCVLLEVSLTRIGCRVRVAHNGPAALAILAAEPIDLVLLDVRMPGMDGFAVCEELRSGRAPQFGIAAGEEMVSIVLLTALNRPDDIVNGFALGADDYITKPFTFKEVEVRLRAIARRRGWEANWIRGQDKAKAGAGRVSAAAKLAAHTGGEIMLEETSHSVLVRGEAVTLTPIEYTLFRALAAREGEIVSREKLFQLVWGYSMVGGTALVDVAIRRLQAKLEVDPEQPRWLRAVRGGYRLGGGEDDLLPLGIPMRR